VVQSDLTFSHIEHDAAVFTHPIIIRPAYDGTIEYYTTTRLCKIPLTERIHNLAHNAPWIDTSQEKMALHALKQLTHV